MGTVIGHLVDIGYGVAWRVLDAQYFGVAQRRRRVFIVGCLGDRTRSQQVLLEPEGVRRDPPARPAQEQVVANTLGGGSGSRGWCDDTDRATFIPIAFHMTQDPISGPISPAIGGVKPTTGYATAAVAYRKATTSHGPENDWERWEEAAHSNTLDAGSNVTRNAHAVVTEMAVRRLTPLECLRLQGFPDDWLDGLGLADSIKYRMAGNAVAVPVVEWLGRRLAAAHIDGRDAT